MDPRARWTVIALCAAQFMLILDVVIINVAVPSIRHDLGLLDSRVQLTAAAYTVTFGSLLIVCGRAGDILGRRRMLLGGLTVFVVASLVAGAAQTDWQLFAARGLQGAGAAMVSANALAAITASLAEGPERNWALGLWAGVGSAGAIAGQLVGGAVTQFLGWRWIFFINVPIGLVVVAVLAVLVHDGSAKGRPRMDLAGALLLAGGLAGAILALSWLAEDGARGRSLAAAAAASALLVAFAIVERRQPAPVLRFALLRLPGVRAANITLLLNAGALGATLFFLTLYLQVVLDYSPLAVGAAFAPITLLILLLSPRAARLTARVGVRRLLATGLVLLAAGALLLARLPAGGDYWTDVLPGMILLAFGSGLAYAPTYIAASSGVPAEEQGAAAGLVNSAQEIGAAVGLALLALVATGVGGTVLVEGYRAGLVGAAAMFAVAAMIAATVPRSLGRADVTGQPVHAVIEEEATT
jgi:EmrB/QacA subfamily drug resistance transporter